MSGELERAQRVFQAAYRDAVAGSPDATDGDIAAGVQQGLAAAFDAFDSGADVRAWATEALDRLPLSGARTAYALGEARALNELLAFLDERHPSPPRDRAELTNARGEVVPF